MAARLEITPLQLAQVETGYEEASSDLLERVAALLDTTIEQLRDSEAVRSEDKQYSLSARQTAQLRMIEFYFVTSCSGAMEERICDMVRVMAQPRLH